MSPSPPTVVRRCREDDRGEVAANTAIFVTVVLLLFTCLQFGLWFYGRQVAASAAQHAVDAARVESGSAGAGHATADQYINQVGGIQNPSVAVTRSDGTVTATVRGRAISIVGFLDPPISVTIEGPVERVIE